MICPIKNRWSSPKYWRTLSGPGLCRAGTAGGALTQLNLSTETLQFTQNHPGTKERTNVHRKDPSGVRRNSHPQAPQQHLLKETDWSWRETPVQRRVISSNLAFSQVRAQVCAFEVEDEPILNKETDHLRGKSSFPYPYPYPSLK